MRGVALILAWVVFFAAFPGDGVFGESYTAPVMAVIEGDIMVLTKGEEGVIVRLDGIDCPERGQPFFMEAWQFVQDRVAGKSVWIEVRQVDHSGKRVARVVIDGTDLSEELLKAGLAWYDSRFARDRRLESIQEEAKKKECGLWALEKPCGPMGLQAGAGRHCSSGGDGRGTL
ncbi:MAG: thermonuclease family protein [Candidatus Eremiobacteraeota bacterium]|nr:thermonuclease family protein [Candidatus Eremiobacteraeota bacterium]